MASATPGRTRLGAGGYYADPSSPIASTPQRKPGATVTKALPTPSMGALSPMRVPEKPMQRHEEEGKGSSSWGGIFSPVLKFFGGAEEEAAAAAAAGGSAGSGSSPMGASSGAGAMPAAPHGHGHAHAYASTAGAARASPATGAVPGTTVPVLAAAPAGRSGAAAAYAAPKGSAGAAVARGVAGLSLSASGGAGASAGAAAAPSFGMAIAPEDEMLTAYCNNKDAAAAREADAGLAPAGSDAEAEYDYEEFNPYLFIKLLPAYEAVAPRVPRILLPRKKSREPLVSLVLDLDETLVHCSVEPIADADVTFPVTFAGTSYQVYVRKRPYLDRFLAWIAGRFEVTIFTASQQVYAEKLLALLDPEARFIDHRLYRDSCLNVDGNYLKDLNVLGRDLSKTVLVDNSPHAFGYQLDNGIPIESWFDDRGDRELLKLVRFLETIQHAPDVRPLVREKFKLHKLVAQAR